MRQVLFVTVLISAASCSDHTSDTPAGPTPPPRAETFTLSGTVSETPPTESTRIAGATITAIAGLDANGPSTTSDASGTFQLAGLVPGTYTIRGRAENYAGSSLPLTLTENQTLAVQLDPVFQMVSTTNSGVFVSDSSCTGYWDYGKSGLARMSATEPCTVDYLFGVHHDGTLEADLAWVDGRFALITELFRSDGGQPSGSPITPRLDGRSRTYSLAAHAQYVLRVSSGSGAPPPVGTTEFTLRVARPN